MIGQDGLGDEVLQPGVPGGQGRLEVLDREFIFVVGKLRDDETDGVVGPVQQVPDNLILPLAFVIQGEIGFVGTVVSFILEGDSVTECDLADLMLRNGSKPAVKGFGCSDCDCQTHLFRVDAERTEKALNGIGMTIFSDKRRYQED